MEQKLHGAPFQVRNWVGMRLSRQSVAVLVVMFLSICSRPGLAALTYPLKQSANRRYLVDHSNAPVMIVGDSPQALIVNLTTNEAAMFFADRATYGYNTLWINLLCATYTGGRADASTIDGILPFTANIPSTGSYDLTTTNEAYFERVDQMLLLAAQNGLQVLLDPCETGSFLSVMLDNGTNKCRAYGQFLGARYKNFPNIIWMSGNDFQTWRNPPDDAVARSVALGILDRDTNHLQTSELDYLVSSSLDDTNWNGILGVNGTYTYFPTYARLWQDYGRPNFLPNFLVEANYEFESLQGPVTTTPILRKQEYWTMTSGACGQMYGNGYTWPFKSGWQANLDTPGAAQLKIMQQFFNARAWFALVPDTNHLLVVSNYGTYSDSSHVADNDFLTAARTSDRSLAVIYTPIIRTFTVDMTQLSGPAVTRWFDPSIGIFTNISGSPFTNSGLRNFTPPGNNNDGDGGWVLVLETNPPPDLPPPPPPPAQPKFIQQNYAVPQSPQAQVSVAYPNAQSSGDANILALGWNDTTASIANVSDSLGNSYQVALPTFRGNGMSQAIYFSPSIQSGNNTVTVMFDQPAAFVDLRVTEYSGIMPTNSFDVGASSTGVGSSADSGPLSPGATNELLFGAGMTATTFTGPGLGFTTRVITSPDGDILEDQIANALGPFSATASLSSGAWLMQLAAFKAALPPPTLRIFATTTNTLIAAWPVTSASFRLQQNSNLASTNWLDVTNTAVVTNSQNQVILSPTSSLRFYRLRYP
jgi:hypothetical protein